MDWNLIRYGLGGVALIGSIVTAIVFQQGALNSETNKEQIPSEKPYSALYKWVQQKNKTYIGNNKEQIIEQLNVVSVNAQGAQYKNTLVRNFGHIKASLPNSKVEISKINQAQQNNRPASEKWAGFIGEWCELKARDETIQLKEKDGVYEDNQSDYKTKQDLEVFQATCTK
ncbi:hypothetical protein [Candidatus Mycoplasma haematohominis]|uniref:hypothetical protein n=1 Tax=Candidatus Mycoplasma haematohominis TaxID=1494318 RepID=UPI001C0A68EA|nr:hypothetical protein [Candidatus Mycoplasma haemohominis]